MDGLIRFSGLSKGTQSSFKESKDFKTNLKFFSQVVCARVIRTVEERCIASGHDELSFFPFFKNV